MEIPYLISANCLVMLYIYTKFPENDSKGFRVIERTRNMTKIYKGHNSVQNENVGEVTVLGLCTSCDDALSLHQISWKYPKGFQRYWADTKSWRMDRWTDGQTDGQGDFYRASADSVRPLQSCWWMDGWHAILRPFQQHFSHIRTMEGW